MRCNNSINKHKISFLPRLNSKQRATQKLVSADILRRVAGGFFFSAGDEDDQMETSEAL
jgi:hypothetical protein